MNEVDEYISGFPPKTRALLRRVRNTIRAAAPNADERMSYRMPAFFVAGRALIYFAAFKAHVGIYPPVRGDELLLRACAPYRGPKGNLRLPMEDLPYGLVRRVAKHQLQRLAKTERARSKRQARGKKVVIAARPRRRQRKASGD